MRAALLVVVAVVGCGGPPPVDHTLCGMAIYDAAPADVAALRAVERLSIEAIARTAVRKGGSAYRVHELCRTLWDVDLFIRSEPWLSSRGTLLCGETHVRPTGDWIELLRPGAWSEACLAHEIIHEAQYRIDGEPDPGHEHWPARGYFEAEAAAQADVAAAGL